MSELKLAVAAALLALAAPAYAQEQDPGEIACMAKSYTADQLAEIERLKIEFTLNEGSNVGERLGNVVNEALFVCYLENEWSEDAAYSAVLYEMGRLSEAAYRQSGGLSPDHIGKLDAALAKGDNEDMWGLVERGVIAGIDGTEPEYTGREQFAMGLFIISAGIPAGDEVATEKVGVLLGFMALQRYSLREFNLAEGVQ